MNLFFSICSNNYLAQATVLRNSIKKFNPEIPFFLFLCDQKIQGMNYSPIADEVIELESIEPDFNRLALKYNIIELNTCLKPRAFEYLFLERKCQQAVYLDPDIQLFHSLANLFTDYPTMNILLTPHIYTPIPDDGKTPAEQSFLIFGIYNLGFISVRHAEESMACLAWWKNRTYTLGYIDTYKGLFVDQLPMNQAPLFFKNIYLLQDLGMNMAPWNLHERVLDFREARYFVNQSEPLKCYHFSSFKTGRTELPLHHYNRFRLDERRDLQKIYTNYQEEILAAGYKEFSAIKNSYESTRKHHLSKIKKRQWIKKILPSTFFYSF